MSGPAGWYGKLPALGDFAQRRLEPAFVAGWDHWLQDCVAASKQTLRTDWLEVYLTAHIWRFLLLPGVVDEQTWAGVMMPSVDRVGRYFPLTVCTPLVAFETGAASLATLEPWLDSLETVARSALDPEIGVDSFDSNLLALGAAPQAVSGLAQGAETAAALSNGARSISLRFGTAGAGAGFQAIAAALLTRSLAGHSIWWCRDTTGETGGLAHLGLPDPQLYATMLAYSPDP